MIRVGIGIHERGDGSLALSVYESGVPSELEKHHAAALQERLQTILTAYAPEVGKQFKEVRGIDGAPIPPSIADALLDEEANHVRLSGFDGLIVSTLALAFLTRREYDTGEEPDILHIFAHATEAAKGVHALAALAPGFNSLPPHKRKREIVEGVFAGALDIVNGKRGADA